MLRLQEERGTLGISNCVVGREKSYFVKIEAPQNIIINIIGRHHSNRQHTVFVQFCGLLFQKTIGIIPLIPDLFLHTYEANFLQEL